MGVAGELLKAMTPPPSNPLRTYVLTGAVAAITATGAWYGAGLKYRQEYKQVRRLLRHSAEATAYVRPRRELQS